MWPQLCDETWKHDGLITTTVAVPLWLTRERISSRKELTKFIQNTVRQ